MTPEAQRLVEECKCYIQDLANWREDDNEGLHEAAWQSVLMTLDRLASLIPAGGLAEEAREASRYRWLRSFATPGQRPAKEDMPMGYREIRLRVDTAVYMPTHWAKDVDRAIDAAMAASTPQGQEKP